MNIENDLANWVMSALQELREIVADAQAAAGNPSGNDCMPSTRDLMDEGETLIQRHIAEAATPQISRPLTLTGEPDVTYSYKVLEDDMDGTLRPLRGDHTTAEHLARIAAWQSYLADQGDLSWEQDIEVYADQTSLGRFHLAYLSDREFMCVPWAKEQTA